MTRTRPKFRFYVRTCPTCGRISVRLTGDQEWSEFFDKKADNNLFSRFKGPIDQVDTGFVVCERHRKRSQKNSPS